jgi:hypothetical protein
VTRVILGKSYRRKRDRVSLLSSSPGIIAIFGTNVNHKGRLGDRGKKTERKSIGKTRRSRSCLSEIFHLYQTEFFPYGIATATVRTFLMAETLLPFSFFLLPSSFFPLTFAISLQEKKPGFSREIRYLDEKFRKRNPVFPSFSTRQTLGIRNFRGGTHIF